MKIKIALLFCFTLVMGLAFQNCSDDVGFDSKISSASDSNSNPLGEGVLTDNEDDGESPPVICDPLNPESSCDGQAETGLIGKLYYLTYNQHGSLFNNNLNNANLQDYRDHGIQVPVDIVMTSVNVPKRSWTVGFTLPDGSLVKDGSGNSLNEWFHLDLHGFITMPAGNYQFATISDDGVRVTIDGNIVIENDTIHGPTWDCASNMVQFNGSEKKIIRVEYHQGPRTEIALQLFYRSASQIDQSCGKQGGFNIVDSVNLRNR